MTREEAKVFLTDISYDLGTVGMEYLSVKDGEKMRDAIEILEQEPILNKLKAEINKNIEQEDFARSVFINEEKDYRKANQCTGNLQAYEKVLDMIDNLLKENKNG